MFKKKLWIIYTFQQSAFLICDTDLSADLLIFPQDVFAR